MKRHTDSGTFETRITDPARYPLVRLEKTAANLRAAIEDVDLTCASCTSRKFFLHRLLAVEAEISLRRYAA